jgi:hypothetical protein
MGHGELFWKSFIVLCMCLLYVHGNGGTRDEFVRGFDMDADLVLQLFHLACDIGLLSRPRHDRIYERGAELKRCARWSTHVRETSG